MSDGWDRLLAAARRKLERGGGELSGTVSIANPTDAERHVIIGITGRHRGAGVTSMRIKLAELDRALRASRGTGLVDVLEHEGGPVRDRSAERAADERDRAAALEELARRAGSHRDEPWFARLSEQLATDGTATRFVRRGDAEQLGLAGAVLDQLPIDAVPLPVLAERATGNTKALSGTPLASLVLRALALRDGVDAPTTSRQQRELWESAGVIVDDLASQVLVLNLPTWEDELLGGWLTEAARAGVPLRVTLHQLTVSPVTPQAEEVWVCENPAVLRAAAGELGASSAPLVCTEGQPSAACHTLLASVAGRIHWRGDFDWTGLRTTAMALERYAAMPWRMDTASYLHALESGESEPLKGTSAPSPWEPDLSAALSRNGRTVMEERLIPALLDDLKR